MRGQEKAGSADKPKQRFCSIKAGELDIAYCFRQGTDCLPVPALVVCIKQCCSMGKRFRAKIWLIFRKNRWKSTTNGSVTHKLENCSSSLILPPSWQSHGNKVCPFPQLPSWHFSNPPSALNPGVMLLLSVLRPHWLEPQQQTTKWHTQHALSTQCPTRPISPAGRWHSCAPRVTQRQNTVLCRCCFHCAWWLRWSPNRCKWKRNGAEGHFWHRQPTAPCHRRSYAQHSRQGGPEFQAVPRGQVTACWPLQDSFSKILQELQCCLQGFAVWTKGALDPTGTVSGNEMVNYTLFAIIIPAPTHALCRLHEWAVSAHRLARQ